MAMLVRVLGPLPAAVGLAVTASLVPFSTLVGRELGKLRKATVSATDERLKLTSEVLGGIKAVKIYGWEAAYTLRIEALREEELRRARRGALVGVANTLMFTGAPILISLSAFAAFALSGRRQLTADVAFPALALFQLLRFPVTMLPSQVTALIQGKVALGRIQGFLEDEEVEGRGARGGGDGRGSPLGVGGVEVRSAAFAWSKEGGPPPKITLSVSSLRVHPGSLVVVVGPVGSGKSSLLAALLGEMHSFPLHEEEAGAAGDGGGGNLDRGESSATPATPLVSVRGTVAFCSQEPWIQNATVRENVTFGLPSTENDDGDEEEEEDEATAVSVVGNGSRGSSSKESPPPPSSRRRFRRQWYERCLDACALRPDLAELPAKDLQEIGERGVNLSGGQRARVALARACYADADVYLLDDPLSAVDAHVGASLWSDCLNGILKNKTRILATHHAHYAAAADAVVVMKGGKVEAFGRPEELAARGVDFGEMEKLLVGEAGAGASSLPPSPRAIQPQTPSPQKGAATAPAAAAPSAAAFLPSAPESDGGGGGEQRQQLQQRQQAAAAAAAAATATAVESPRGASLPSSTLPPWSTVAQDAAAQEEKEKELKRKKALEVEGGEEETTALIPAATAAPSSPSSGAARGSALGPASSSRIVRAEGRAVGKVSRAVYATYLSAWGSVLGGGAGGGGVGARFGEEEEGEEGEEGGAAGGGGGGGAGPGASPSAPPPAAAAAPSPRLPPSLPLPLLVLALAALERALQVGQNLWLASWSDRTASGRPPPAAAAVGALAALGLSSLALQAARAAATVLGSLRAASALHSRMLRRVLRLPMAFFDAQPQGRLTNRFSRDVETLDSALGDVVQSALTCAASTAFAVAVVVGVAPLSVVAIIPLTLVYWRVQTRYISASREVKRLDSLAASPVFGAFGEALNGLPTLRAFEGAAERARGAQRRLLDGASFLFRVLRERERRKKKTRPLETQPRLFFPKLTPFFLYKTGAARTYWPMVTLNRWLSVRLELLAQGVVLGAAVLVALSGGGGGGGSSSASGGRSGRDASPSDSSAGLAGLALTSAISLTGLLNWMVRKATELEVNMNAVERVDEYCSEKTEAPYYSSSPSSLSPSSRRISPPPAGWPSRGEVSIRDLTVRYRPGLEPVLKGIRVEIPAGCKVGVAGRTGSGKSTLVLALFRVVEADPGSRILIDGVDVSRVGLFDLRSRLALVPQEPTLFSGSVAQNLDPFRKEGAPGAGGDGRLWAALDAAGGLGDAVRAMPGQLRALVAEGGSNLSSGQRQLLCVARALLRRPKVLVLDEATAAVDGAADAAVGHVLRGARFAASTVITIAHRLHGIAGADKVLVLDRGEVKEYGDPRVLLRQEGSAFRGMVLRAAASTAGGRANGGVASSSSDAAAAAATSEDAEAFARAASAADLLRRAEGA